MPRPIAASRLHDILAQIDADRAVSVEALAERFAVSRETIRRDLKALAGRGLLDVVHGGALKRETREPPFEERRSENAEGKAAVARAAVALVADGMVVLLDAGATTYAIAEALAGAAARDVTICTTSLPAARTLVRAGRPVALLGGEIEPNDEATYGVDVVAGLARYRIDLAFVGVGGVSPDGAITDFSRAYAEQRTAMLDAARAAYLVADSTKFGRAGPVRLRWTRPLAGLIVDAAPPTPFAAALKRAGVPVLVAADL